MKTLGQFIKDRRRELGLTQEKLAQLVGYETRGAISFIERDERTVPMDKLDDFASALQVGADTILSYMVGPAKITYKIGYSPESLDEPGMKERAFLFSKIRDATPETVKKFAELWKLIEDEDQAN